MFLRSQRNVQISKHYSFFIPIFSSSFSCHYHAISRNSLMPAQLGSLCEIFPALVAHKRFLSCVCSDVVVQGSGAGKSTGTVAALEWLLTGMTDSMCAQLGWVREALFAVAALIWFLWSPVTDVNLEHGPLGERFFTLTAFPKAQLSDTGKYWFFCFCQIVVSIFTVAW